MPRKRNLKTIRKKVVAVDDDGENDNSVMCGICGENGHPSDYCPLIISGVRVEDSSLPSKAILTLPQNIQATKLNDGKYSVTVKSKISKGTQFGPLDAPKTKFFNPKCPYVLKIFNGTNSSYFLDTSDEYECNWMSLVPFVNQDENDFNTRNCICYQLDDKIYFTVLRDLKIGEALKVTYSPGYINRLSSSTQEEPKVLDHGTNKQEENSIISITTSHEGEKGDDDDERIEMSTFEVVDQDNKIIIYKVSEALSTNTNAETLPTNSLISQLSPGYGQKLVETHNHQAVDHDYVIEVITTTATNSEIFHNNEQNEYKNSFSTSTRKSGRQRKAVDFKNFVTEYSHLNTLSSSSSPSTTTTTSIKKRNVQKEKGNTLKSSNSASIKSESGHLKRKTKTTKKNYQTQESSSDNDYDTNEIDLTDSTVSGLKKKKRRKITRLGAVLPLDEWECKFCHKVETNISNFSIHLIAHYKQVGAARTEKSRLTKKLPNSMIQIKEEKVDDVEEENDNQEYEDYEKEVTIEENPDDSREKGNNNNNDDDDEVPIKNSCDVPKFPYYCDICVVKKVFNRAEYLIRHLRLHAGDEICPSCNHGFSKDIYDEHKNSCQGRNREGEEKVFYCTPGKPITKNNVNNDTKKSCPTSTTKHLNINCTNKQTGNHRDIILLHKCSLCKSTFSKSRELDKHLKTHHQPEELICQFCQKYLNNNTFKIHTTFCEAAYQFNSLSSSSSCVVETESSGVSSSTLLPSLILSVVQENSKSEDSKNNDIQEEEDGDDNNSYSNKRSISCPNCRAEFTTVSSFYTHVSTHTHPSMCPDCNLRFSNNMNNIKDHTCSKFKCDGCENEEEFETFILFNKHIREVHEAAEFYCLECALPFVTQDGWNDHKCQIGKTHDRNSDGVVKKNFPISSKKSSSSRKESETGCFVCETCGSQYTKWSSLKTHRNLHRPKRFICSTCGKSFHRREMLIEHEFVHQEPQFQCTECGKRLKSKKSLEVHTQIHKGNKRFKCEKCDKAFCQKVNLKTHQLTHVPTELKGFECPTCNRRFATKEYLGFHIEGHEKGKTEQCELCGKSFIKPHMLNHHKKIAHGNQRYLCEFCNGSFRQRHSLVRHLGKSHLEHQDKWSVPGYMKTRFFPGDGKFTHQNVNLRRLANCDPVRARVYGLATGSDNEYENIENPGDINTVQKIEVVSHNEDEGNGSINNVNESQCEIVETEEITYTEGMIIPENSNMMILQVEESGEFVLTLTGPDSNVEGMIVEEF